MKKSYVISYVICFIIGIFLLGVSVFLCREYLLAEIKLETIATVVDVDTRKMYKKDSDGDKEAYYEYTLYWEYKVDDVVNKYTTKQKNSVSGVYSPGKQQTITLYSNDGENYYTFDWGTSIVIGGIGAFILVVGIIDCICVTKRKKAQENWQEVIKQRVKEAEEKKKQQKNNE